MLKHTEVRYEVTDNCNASCIMCPRDKHTRPHGIMCTEQYKRSVDEVVALGAKQVVLTGFGEPLLDKQLEVKIAYAKQRGLRTYIITNASALTAKRSLSLMRAGLDEMRVSFYGTSAATYEAVMRKLSYKRAEAALRDFLSLRRALGAKTVVQMSFLAIPGVNDHEADEFRRVWEPRVDFVELWRPHNFGDGRDYRDRQGKRTTCGRPANGPLQIQWDGTVIPCCYDYNNSIVLGNAFMEPVMDILRGERYAALRQAHADGQFDEFPFCAQCDQLLSHDDAFIYSNRHEMPPSVAVQLSNTDLYNLARGSEHE